MKQLFVDPTSSQVTIGTDTPGAFLLPGYVSVGDDQYNLFLIATGPVYFIDGKVTSKETLSGLQTRLSRQVDDFVASIYNTWTRFEQEYLLRENAATAYVAGGYTGDVSIWISGFATPAGITPKAAADLILSQAVLLNGALQSLGALRMRKYEISAAKDSTTAQASYDDIISKCEAIAATLS